MSRNSSQSIFDAAVKEACHSFKQHFEFGTSEEVRLSHHFISKIEKELSNPELVRLSKESYKKDNSIDQYDICVDWKSFEREFEIIVRMSKYDMFAYNLLRNITSLLFEKKIPISSWPFAIEKWAGDNFKRRLKAPPGKGGRASQYFRDKVIVTIMGEVADKHGLTATRNTKSNTKHSAADAAVKAYLITINGYPEEHEYDEENKRDYEAKYDKLYSTVTKAWSEKGRLISPYHTIQIRCIVEAEFSKNFPLSEFPPPEFPPRLKIPGR